MHRVTGGLATVASTALAAGSAWNQVAFDPDKVVAVAGSALIAVPLLVTAVLGVIVAADEVGPRRGAVALLTVTGFLATASLPAFVSRGILAGDGLLFLTGFIVWAMAAAVGAVALWQTRDRVGARTPIDAGVRVVAVATAVALAVAASLPQRLHPEEAVLQGTLEQWGPQLVGGPLGVTITRLLAIAVLLGGAVALAFARDRRAWTGVAAGLALTAWSSLAAAAVFAVRFGGAAVGFDLPIEGLAMVVLAVLALVVGRGGNRDTNERGHVRPEPSPSRSPERTI